MVNELTDTDKDEEIEFDPMIFLSSSELVKPKLQEQYPQAEVNEDSKEEESIDPRMKDPIFSKLAKPELAPLPRENRARLQMQSPNRLYFYWSIKNNPFQTLNKALSGRTGSYVLVVKLRNNNTGAVEIYPVGVEGSWWFDVLPENSYQAEIGFYAPNRPYINIIRSNSIQTPRMKPSKRRDYTPSFTVEANQFARVLDASGYKRDAVDVAIAGDDSKAADEATTQSIRALTSDAADFTSDQLEEIRFALYSIASGYRVADISGYLSPEIFDLIKQELDSVDSELVLDELKKHFDIVADEIFEGLEIGAKTYGASMINFPHSKKLRRVPRTLVPKRADLEISNAETISSESFIK